MSSPFYFTLLSTADHKNFSGFASGDGAPSPVERLRVLFPLFELLDDLTLLVVLGRLVGGLHARGLVSFRLTRNLSRHVGIRVRGLLSPLRVLLWFVSTFTYSGSCACLLFEKGGPSALLLDKPFVPRSSFCCLSTSFFHYPAPEDIKPSGVKTRQRLPLKHDLV